MALNFSTSAHGSQNGDVDSMLEQKTSIEVGANQSSTQRVRPMPPCERAGKISSTASAEFSDTKVLNVVTRSRALNFALNHGNAG